MDLKAGQLVVFENGHKAGMAEVCWSNKRQAFALATGETDEEGRPVILYSNTVIEKQAKPIRKFIPTKQTCTKEIIPIGETEKAYQIEDGTNGHTRHVKEYYKYIAKSVCFIDEQGRIFAPAWA